MRLLLAVLATLSLGWPWMAQALQPDKPLHQYVRGNWSIEEGLPQISALAITQDGAGYIWIGTQAGLARFDGVRIVEYTSENTPDLPGNWVPTLHVAADGRMWVGTYKGVVVHDGQRFTPVMAADGTASASSVDTRDFAQDARGTIWVATTAGVHRVEGDRLHLVPNSPLLTQSLVARADGLWVGARGAVHRYRDERWQALPLPPDAATATVNALVDAHDRLWAATTMGLFVHTPQGWERFDGAPQLARATVDLLYLDRDGNLWAGGDAGIARLRDGRLVAFVTPSDPGAIAGVRTAFEDREGGLWMGSQWEGLTRLGDSWTRRYSVAEGLNDPIVWSLSAAPDGRRIWVGGNEGLSMLENGRVQEVVPASALPHPQAYNLLAEADRVWVGTRRGLAVVELNSRGVAAVRQPAVFAPLAGSQINGILRLDNQDLWIATTDGLYRLRDQQLRRYAQADGLVDPRIRFFFQTAQGEILAGTQSGLFELRDERFHLVGEDAGLPLLDVTAIGQLQDGRWVIGTLGEQTYYRHKGRWQLLGIEQGMPGNAPFFFTEQGGYLWAGGIRGISRVPVAELEALAEGRIAQVRGQMLLNERGDARSGQQGYCCNGAGNSKGIRRGSTLWLPTRDGVLAMDVDSITMNKVAPGVVVERVQVGEEWRSADAVGNTTLPQDARDLSFEFTVLSFQDPKSTGVQYRLRGYDNDWRPADPLNRNARYTNLPPGDYVFEVAGTNNAGVAGTASALLPFAIAPHFHETAWFDLLLALLLIALGYAGYRFMQHRHRQQRQSLETLVLQRTEALEVANRQLEEASHTDPLTGLRNRRYMASQIPADLAYYDRQVERGMHADEVMVFAMVDIDHFKTINDSHGHSAGDLVLQQFATLLNHLVRSGDYVVRWGGEEFLLVFRPMPMRNLQVIGNRIRDTVNAHAFDIDHGRSLRLTCSIGLSEYPLFRDQAGRISWETMVELADQALYYVKTNGRDGWAAFRPTERTDLATLIGDLHKGPHELLEKRELELIRSQTNPALVE